MYFDVQRWELKGIPGRDDRVGKSRRQEIEKSVIKQMLVIPTHMPYKCLRGNLTF